MKESTMMKEGNGHTVSAPKKRLYTRPILHEYGSVKDLTASGLSGPNENSGGMMTTSDRTIKENIVKIGTHPLGIGIYLFDYKFEYCEVGGHGRQFGVMADEVEALMPEAVSLRPDGYKMVNYAMLGMSRTPK